MAIEKFIFARLKDNLTGGIVGDRIFPVTIPQEVQGDVVSYQQISLSPNYCKSRTSGMDDMRFQFDCYSKKYDDCVALRDAVRKDLEGYRGDFENIHIHTITIETTTDGIVEAKDLFRKIIDFNISVEYVS